jgi:hypothetical protein
MLPIWTIPSIRPPADRLAWPAFLRNEGSQFVTVPGTKRRSMLASISWELSFLPEALPLTQSEAFARSTSREIEKQHSNDSGVDRVRVTRECRFDKSCQTAPVAFGNNYIHLIGPNGQGSSSAQKLCLRFDAGYSQRIRI